MSRDPRPAGAVGLRLELAAPDRDRLRIVAAKAGQSMATFLRHIVLEHLDRIESREGDKPRRK